MIVIGVDPATYELGLAALETKDGETLSLLDVKHISAGDKQDLITRLEYIYSEASDFYNKYPPDFIAIESQYLQNAKAMRIIAYSVGVLAIAGLLVRPGVPVEIVEAKKWRKVAFGDGNLSKRDIIKLTKERFLVDNLTPDTAEAIGIAMAGVKLATGEA